MLYLKFFYNNVFRERFLKKQAFQPQTRVIADEFLYWQIKLNVVKLVEKNWVKAYFLRKSRIYEKGLEPFGFTPNNKLFFFLVGSFIEKFLSPKMAVGVFTH